MARDQVDLTPIERRDELVNWLAEGAKPKSQFRIGTEHEKFAFTLEGHRPVPYEGRRGIRALLEGMQHGTDKNTRAPVRVLHLLPGSATPGITPFSIRWQSSR